MSTNQEIQALLDFAVTIARESGDIALKYFRSDLEVENKPGDKKYDPVTLADKEVEDYLRTKIQQRYPEHTIIGEEGGTSTGTETFKWLIDPIDGTRGFIAGSPMWGTLMGIMDDEECIAGLMHQPFVNETFIGSCAGAFLMNSSGNKQITTSDKQQLSDCVLCCTHLAMFHGSRELDAFIKVANITRFSRFGTDCYGYCLLAHGFVDVIVEGNMQPYDIVPLIPIVEAAGGVITDWEGKSAHNGGNIVAAANAAIHEQALKLISKRN